MRQYIVVDLMAEADPENQNRIGFNDPKKYPNQNFHPTRYGVYKTGEESALVAYVPDWHDNPKVIAESIAYALEELTLA